MSTTLILLFATLPFVHYHSTHSAFQQPRWALAFIALSLILICSRKHLRLPKLPRTVFLMISAWLLYPLINLYLNGLPLFSGLFGERIWFVLFTLFLHQFNLKKFLTGIFLKIHILTGTGLIVLWTLIQYKVMSPILDFSPRGLTLGYVNFAAQYFGILYCIFLHYLIRAPNKKQKIFCSIYLVISIYFIHITGCRSVHVAIFIATLVYACTILSHSMLSTKKLILSALVGMVCFSTIFIFFPSKKNIFNLWQNSTKHRLEMWSSSLKIAYQNPLGIGDEQYTFNDIQYRIEKNLPIEEFNFSHNPHNEFLRTLVENGLVGSCIFLFFLFYFFTSLMSWKLPKHSLGSLLIIYLLIESIFQFPLLYAIPNIYLSLSIALLIKNNSIKNKIIDIPKYFKFSIAFYFILCASYYTTRALMLTGNAPQKASTLICDINPADWLSCLKSANFHSTEGNYNQSAAILKQLLSYSAYNYPAIKSLSQIELKRGNIDKSCSYLNQYVEIFKTKTTSIQAEIGQFCDP